MTKTELCNRALAILGHDRLISDIDGMTDGEYHDKSTEAMRCRQFFATALEETLSAHDWDFAAVEAPLRLTARDQNGYAIVPTIPDCLRVIRVIDDLGHSLKVRRARDYMQIRIGASNKAIIRYVSSDVDIDTLPPKFREAFVYHLAACICGPMYGSDSKTEGFVNLARMKLADAINVETDETASPGEWENPFLVARK